MRIGEIAEKTGLSISNIRFYEKKGLIEPAREKQSKYRDYTEEDIKRINNQAFNQLDIDFYLNYVKGEEANGTKFAEIDELLIDFTNFTQFDRIYFGLIYLKPWINRLVMLLWAMMWVAIPVCGIIDACLDSNCVSIGIIMFWMAWLILFGIHSYSLEKEKVLKKYFNTIRVVK